MDEDDAASDAYEAFSEALLGEMKDALLAAYERALAKMQAYPDNQLNPDSTIDSMKFCLVQAASAAAAELMGEKKARDAFELATTPGDQEMVFTFPNLKPRNKARQRIQKASRKANRR